MWKIKEMRHHYDAQFIIKAGPIGNQWRSSIVQGTLWPWIPLCGLELSPWGQEVGWGEWVTQSHSLKMNLVSKLDSCMALRMNLKGLSLSPRTTTGLTLISWTNIFNSSMRSPKASAFWCVSRVVCVRVPQAPCKELMMSWGCQVSVLLAILSYCLPYWDSQETMGD